MLLLPIEKTVFDLDVTHKTAIIDEAHPKQPNPASPCRAEPTAADAACAQYQSTHSYNAYSLRSSPRNQWLQAL